MKIRALSAEELKTTYVDLFTNSFGEWDDNQNPSFVLVGQHDDGKIFGFVACQLHNKKTVYMPHVGIVDESKSKGHPRFMLEVYKYLQKRGVILLLGKIHQLDIVTLILSLKMGWFVYGVERFGSDLMLLISRYIGGKDGVRSSEQSTG
jgi:hypothetical protein